MDTLFKVLLILRKMRGYVAGANCQIWSQVGSTVSLCKPPSDHVQNESSESCVCRRQARKHKKKIKKKKSLCTLCILARKEGGIRFSGVHGANV